MIKCILCNTEKVSFYDNYKFHVINDKKYFGETKIYKCNTCDFGFCDPMPKKENLNYFYNKVYRAAGRPHEINYHALDLQLYSHTNLNYLQYLTTFIDFKKISSVLDFGSGLGDIGYLLKKKFKHLELFSCENDVYCKKVLSKREYTIYDYNNFDEINEKFDLIISTHSLEHMANFQFLEMLKKKTHSNSYLFLEVPNCPLDDNYKNRPYDSPHLMFFSLKSLEELNKRFKFVTLNLNYSSYSLNQSFKYMKQFKQNYENWSIFNKLEKKIKDFIRIFIPKIFYDFKLFLFQKKIDKLDHYVLNRKDSWCVRGIFRIQSDL